MLANCGSFTHISNKFPFFFKVIIHTVEVKKKFIDWFNHIKELERTNCCFHFNAFISFVTRKSVGILNHAIILFMLEWLNALILLTIRNIKLLNTTKSCRICDMSVVGSLPVLYVIFS